MSIWYGRRVWRDNDDMVDGDEGVMMANFDCIYAAVTIRQMPSDERLEIVLCKLEMNTEMYYKYIKRSSDKCGERRKKKKEKRRNDEK